MFDRLVEIYAKYVWWSITNLPVVGNICETTATTKTRMEHKRLLIKMKQDYGVLSSANDDLSSQNALVIRKIEDLSGIIQTLTTANMELSHASATLLSDKEHQAVRIGTLTAANVELSSSSVTLLSDNEQHAGLIGTLTVTNAELLSASEALRDERDECIRTLTAVNAANDWFAVTVNGVRRMMTEMYDLTPDQLNDVKVLSVDLTAAIGKSTYEVITERAYKILHVLHEDFFHVSGSQLRQLTIDCNGLRLSKAVTRVPDGFFFCWANLKYLDLGEGVLRLQRHAFATIKNQSDDETPTGADALTEVFIPRQLVQIDRSCFQGRKSLASVTFAVDHQIDAITRSCFKDCGLSNISLPTTLKVIAESAFERNINLSGTVVIPQLVDTIGNGAFRGCTKIDSVDMGLCQAITSLEPYIFQNTGASTVTLPPGLIKIGRETFAGMTTLTTIKFPANLSNIGYRAFSGCTTLHTATFDSSLSHTSTPNATGIIEKFSFERTALTSFDVPDVFAQIQDQAFIRVPLETLTIGNGVTLLGVSAFAYNPARLTVSFGTALCTIAETCFQNTKFVNAIAFPTSLRSIGRMAFSSSSARSLTLNDGLEFIDEMAFTSFHITDDGASRMLILPTTLITIDTAAFAQATFTDVQFGGSDVSVVQVGNRALSFVSYSADANDLVLPLAIQSRVQLGDHIFGYVTLKVVFV